MSLPKNHSLYIGAKQKSGAANTSDEPNHGSVWKCENWNQ